ATWRRRGRPGKTAWRGCPGRGAGGAWRGRRGVSWPHAAWQLPRAKPGAATTRRRAFPTNLLLTAPGGLLFSATLSVRKKRVPTVRRPGGASWQRPAGPAGERCGSAGAALRAGRTWGYAQTIDRRDGAAVGGRRPLAGHRVRPVHGRAAAAGHRA